MRQGVLIACEFVEILLICYALLVEISTRRSCVSELIQVHSEQNNELNIRVLIV